MEFLFLFLFAEELIIRLAYQIHPRKTATIDRITKSILGNVKKLNLKHSSGVINQLVNCSFGNCILKRIDLQSASKAPLLDASIILGLQLFNINYMRFAFFILIIY